MILYTNKHKIAFQIDEVYADLVSLYSWRVNTGGYIITGKECIRLHNLLFSPAPIGLVWDHKDRDRKNNCKDNLRLVTHSVNMRNCAIRKANQTGAKGVTIVGSKYLVHITVDGKCSHIGTFTDLDDAVSARRAAELEFGYTS